MLMVPALLALTLTSPDFKDGATVPKVFVWNKNGCAGDNRTPRLRWDAPPRGTRAFALTVVDRDAPKPGGWVHWLAFDIPANARALGRFEPRTAVDGRNDFGTIGWGGPWPPAGPVHHYTFTLDALDIAPHFDARTSYDAYRARIEGHVVGSATIVPMYKR